MISLCCFGKKYSIASTPYVERIVNVGKAGWTILKGHDCYGNELQPVGSTCFLPSVNSCISLC